MDFLLWSYLSIMIGGVGYIAYMFYEMVSYFMHINSKYNNVKHDLSNLQAIHKYGLLNMDFLSKYQICARTRKFNCWRGTLMYYGCVNSPIWVNDPSLMEAWILKQTNLISCPKKNSLVIFRSLENGELIHTAIYLGKNKLWHKQGSNEASIMYLNEMNRLYPNTYIQYAHPK